MSNGIKYVITFIGGAAVGSITAWLFLKKKYERFAQEEIDSVKEVFGKRFKPKKFEPGALDPVEDNEYRTPKGTEEERSELKKAVKDLGYTNDTKEGEVVANKPYVISPDEFRELAEYSTASYTYYADGVMTNEFEEVMDEEEIESTVGIDAVNHFGEYEPDSVFVRNDELEVDYEILKDESRYHDKYPGPEDE